ncbi:ATPase family protein associated with various cellular activities (AAA) [Herbihabitans rhizosphaerae]|uniref:ATPase family protein associated with various cellular activities (AAA) n=1 Tax=Herbihabitans rhizosphaerae TaxID=1872711 RepID=A0A4Q7KVS1_9PSEU|nr:ATP-binding protein [Herbihabitans rhizosphaerae]RZS40765.1 ATPase family protein associated with various cellular activities (AAA) [Herbihabitans rhizosphaerae]
MTDSAVDPSDAIELATSLRAMLDAATAALPSRGDSPLVRAITDHLGCPLNQIPNVTARWAAWEHANLHRGIEAYLAEYSPDAAWFGVGGSGRSHSDLIDLLTSQGTVADIGPVDYASVAVGPDTSVDAVQFGLVQAVAPGGEPVVVVVRGSNPYHGDQSCTLQVLAVDRAVATTVRERVEDLMRERDVFRGQVLSFGFSEHRGNKLVSFQPRPSLTADDVVLPPGVLDTIERHVVLAEARADTLRAAGQHLKRGLLLHGPPGTGKTHTIRYLESRMADTTVVLVAGKALSMIGEATALARRLQPSVVVVEDVDLIAQDRSYGSMGASNPLLFQLLNELDGIGADANVTFVLTTNRVEVLEHALTDRPGRVDLAVEIPRPDADCREQLLRRYTRDVTLRVPDAGDIVAATDGVTASFIRELARRAVLRAADEATDGELVLDEPTVRGALDDLLDERNALTRTVLGGRAAG